MLSSLRLLAIASLLIIIQVWILGYTRLFGWATPFVYPALLLFLPMRLKPITLTIIGAAVGAVLDWLMLTPGLHMASFTLTCFLHHYLLRQFTDQNMNLDLSPCYQSIGGASILLYLEVLLVHHIVLYGLNASFHFDWGILLRGFTLGYLVSFVLGMIALLSQGIGSRSHG